MSRPRIGLTTYYTDARWGVWSGTAAIAPAAYVEAVAAAGGVPLLLPPVVDDTSVLDVLDGLLVLGGGDVDPTAYDASPHAETVPDARRDAHEMPLVRAALETRTPLLAVCRGIQVLNVALGGTLHQHLPDLIGHSDYRPAPGVFGSVEIRTEPGSLIAQTLGEQTAVRCYHHQAIDRVASGLRVTARSEDGLVQAVEPHPAAGWALGVQYHPEESPEDPRLFAALVAAADRHSTRRTTREQEVLTP